MVCLIVALLTFMLFLRAHVGARPLWAPFIIIPLHRPVRSKTISNLPPTIIHQQHANRGIRRLDLMKSAEATPDFELLEKLKRRASVLSPHLQKRYKIADGLARLADTVHAHRASHSDGFGPFNTKRAIMKSSRQSSSHHSITLEIQSNDIGYYGKVQIGTPPRDYNLLMDSGSADLWVGSVNCTADDGDGCVRSRPELLITTDAENKGGHAFLGPSSSSFDETKEKWKVDYGSGSVQGSLVYDDVTIAGLQLPLHKFGVATIESREFRSYACTVPLGPKNIPDDVPVFDYRAPFDGIAGLAKSEISRQNTTPIVDACQQQGLIKKAIVSYKIPRQADNKDDGELTLGGLNPARYDPATLVTVRNINHLGFWEAQIGAILVNGRNTAIGSRTAIFDTGTTLVIAPQEDIDAIHQEIPGAAFDGVAWTVPCDLNTPFALSIGGQEFSVDPRDLAFSPVELDNPSGNCTSGFSSGNIGGDSTWLVGDVFLKNVYMSTNVGADEISFAKLVD